MPLVAAQLGRGSVLADGRTHRLRVRYLERGGQLEVYLDEMSDPVLVAHRLMLHEVLGVEPTPYPNLGPGANPGANPGLTPTADPDPTLTRTLTLTRCSTPRARPSSASPPPATATAPCTSCSTGGSARSSRPPRAAQPVTQHVPRNQSNSPRTPTAPCQLYMQLYLPTGGRSDSALSFFVVFMFIYGTGSVRREAPCV